MNVIGTGLACLDIINDEEMITVMNGGTCANVLTVLSQLGEEIELLLPEYSDDIHKEEFYLTFNKLDVGLLLYAHTKQKIPRIVETYDEKRGHIFYTKCPHCNNSLVKNRFISYRESKRIVPVIKDYDVFFTDRVSDGIKSIAKEFNEKGAKVFYEPNSGRNVKALVEMAKLSNVLKFSTDRINMRMAEELLLQCQGNTLEVIIATHGKDGLSFCYKMKDGTFSKWLKGPHIVFNRMQDTSGAGDWLTAGFLHYWNRNGFELCEEVLYDSIENGLKLSEIASMTKGAQGAFYNKEVFELLKSKYDIKLNTPLKQYDGYIERPYCNFCLSEC